ncbi:MAG: TatD family hydrolase [Cyclobacteriaceae bacterium]|nr:TatD family hydrolase [Cyclobacteriaceae bacterium]
MIIDSHAHIYLEQFDDDRAEMIDRAQQAGVTEILMPNIDHTSIEAMMEAELRHPGMCFAMMGLHPCSVDKHFEKELYKVEEWLGKRAFKAVGEIGTDLYWDKTFWPEQQEAFRIQCELAVTHGLPVVIHSRESIDETIEMVRPFTEKGLSGVFHCFTGNEQQAERIMEMGFYLGIGGVLTFKKSGLDAVVKKTGLDQLILETDSPYLAPTPFRGKRNEPSYLTFVVEVLAAAMGMEANEVMEKTTRNTRSLFTSHEL